MRNDIDSENDEEKIGNYELRAYYYENSLNSYWNLPIF